MYGVVDGAYYNNLDRTEELSKRMYNRNIPSGPLQPNFSIRSVSTKYDMMPIFDRRPQPTVAIKQQPTYNVQNTFNPGTAQAPWSGFSAHINDESTLRNQFFAIQKSAQSTYIPPSTSDMYEENVYSGNTVLQQPFPDLFYKPALETFNPNTLGIARNTFSNHTRQQIKMI
jgi:hypothetical protein